MLYFSEIAVSAVGVERAEEWMWLESAGISVSGQFVRQRATGPTRRRMAGENEPPREIS